MSDLPPGVTIEKIPLQAQRVSALVFRHSRQRQIMSLIMLLAFAAVGVAMYFNAETADLPIVGRSPAFTRVFAIFSVLFMLGMAVSMVKLLLNPQTYVALSPDGILASHTKPPAFIAWTDVEDVAVFGSDARRGTGIRVRDAQSIAALQPFHKRMASSRSFSGWDWGFGSKAFESRPELVETALQFFYFHPEQRAQLGTPRSLDLVQEAIEQKWHKPTQASPIPEP